MTLVWPELGILAQKNQIYRRQPKNKLHMIFDIHFITSRSMLVQLPNEAQCLTAFKPKNMTSARNQRPARYINRVPSELWSLEGFCSCIIFCGGEPKEQLFYFFYRTLESVIKDKNGAATYDKAQKLLSNKKSDQKKVSKMGKEYGAQVSNTKENDKRSPETNVVSPDSITRSEAYKSVEFEPILAKDLLHSVKPSKIPEPVKEYLDKNSMPNKMSTEEEVQRWFNGYMPDISIVSKEDAADRALVPKYVYTVLELKKPKSTSGLADDDKGQLLDYVRVLLQQQPSRQDRDQFPKFLKILRIDLCLYVIYQPKVF
ncbi:hypothetical protein C2G38_2033820 [Gigaspora rosea]|uniref:DUF6826 domain-containing protein n=1 Tax=Gigaspora rosea TaxID=44941 RepID=A0A397VI73_9GLOM|nr:hypothetical protein C2G38_2033820 [Gigaspora rosea]